MKKHIFSLIIISAVFLSFNIVNAEEANWCHNFNESMKLTSEGAEVSALQTALFQQGFYDQEITGDFDQYTHLAVIKFQEKYKAEILTPSRLARGTGFVGKSTKAKLNKLYGCATSSQATAVPLSCTNYFDKTCPSNCTINSDADCCANNGKYWLKTSWSYACYDTNYGSGCIAGQMCSLVPDGCCPNWCFSDSDYDCCVQAGKCWTNNQCGICPSVGKTATTTSNASSSLTAPKIATSTKATTTTSKLSTSTVYCVDTDNGVEQYVYGKVYEKNNISYYDACEGNQIKEWYCSGLGKAYKYIDCPSGCIDGVCRKSEGNSTTTNVVCTDSENGKNYYSAGYSVHGTGNLVNYDICIDNNTVKENFCDNGYYNYQFYTCPRGCQNNACINDGSYQDPDSSALPAASSTVSASTTASSAICTDSDRGRNYYLKGSGSGWSEDDELIKFSDVCYKETSAESSAYCSGSACYLAENYCEGKSLKTELGIKCPNGCKDGACLSATASKEAAIEDMKDQLANISLMIPKLLEELRKLMQ